MALPGLQEMDFLGFSTGAKQITNTQSLYADILAEQQELNRLQMEREDTAYQRQVADMKAAGLNPWLAVSGGGAAAASMTSPKKSALDSLISMLDLNSNVIHRGNSEMNDAWNTGAKWASVFTALGALVAGL